MFTQAWRTALYKKMLLHLDTHPDVQLVRRVGAALLQEADDAEADRKIHVRPTWCHPTDWKFEVVDDSGSSKAPAACVAYGGKVGRVQHLPLWSFISAKPRVTKVAKAINTVGVRALHGWVDRCLRWRAYCMHACVQYGTCNVNCKPLNGCCFPRA